MWPLTYVIGTVLPFASTDFTCSRLVSKSSTSGAEASFKSNRIVIFPVSGEVRASGIDSDNSYRRLLTLAARLVATSSGTPESGVMVCPPPLASLRASSGAAAP